MAAAAATPAFKNPDGTQYVAPTTDAQYIGAPKFAAPTASPFGAAAPANPTAPSAANPLGATDVFGTITPIANPWAGSNQAVQNAYVNALQSQHGIPNGESYANSVAATVLQQTDPKAYAAYQVRVAEAQHAAGGGFWGAFNTVAPYAIVGTAAVASGGAVSGAIGGLGGAIAGGATAGAINAAGSDVIQNKPLTLGSVGKGAVIGGVSGGVGYEAAPAATALNKATGLGTTASNAIVKGAAGAGVGALTGTLTGTGAAKGAEIGGVSGAISGAVQGSGAKAALASEIGATPANVVTGLATSELTGLAGSALTSPSGKSGSTSTGGTAPAKATGSMGLSPGVAPIALGVGAGMAAASSTDSSAATPALDSTTGSTGSSLLSGLGSTIGGMAPYLAVGGIGLAQAAAGEKQSAAYSQQQQALAQPAITTSNQLLSNYNKGVINPADQKLSSTEIAQGNTLLNSPGTAQLSQIASQAFSGYLAGKLQPAQQLQLDQQTAAQKQQVASQLASAGITDSTILDAQYQQIDNNALITKQNMINSNFATGTTAYDQWLTTTEQGQATIQAGMQVASTALQTELANSMAEANIGIGEVNTAIQTQMTTDAAYAAQVSQLMGTLATAYAKSVAGSQSSAGGSPLTSALGKVAGAVGGGGGGGGGSTSSTSPVTGGQISGLTAGSTTGANSIGSQVQPSLDNMDAPVGGYLTPDQLGGTIDGSTSNLGADAYTSNSYY